jgi:hypothetical protein
LKEQSSGDAHIAKSTGAVYTAMIKLTAHVIHSYVPTGAVRVERAKLFSPSEVMGSVVEREYSKSCCSKSTVPKFVISVDEHMNGDLRSSKVPEQNSKRVRMIPIADKQDSLELSSPHGSPAPALDRYS